MSSYAVLSDIHGNRWALEAVLEDIEKQGVSQILNLGDVIYGPLDPIGTANILMQMSIPTVCGNEDRLLLADGDSSSHTLNFVKNQLQREHFIWLRTFQKTLKFEEASLFHGSPDSDTTYLLWEITPQGTVPRNVHDIELLIPSINSSLILCGHDHIQQSFQLSDGRTVLNPGSVGCPAFSDDYLFPHVMEACTPHARYSIVNMTENHCSIDHRSIRYDWETAANVARKNDHDDWSHWLKTGRA